MTVPEQALQVALLSANPAQANPYLALMQEGLAAAGVAATVYHDPGPDGLPAAARGADVVHLHWLELWGRPAYRSLQGMGGASFAGRGLRRWGEPLINSAPVFSARRRRFLARLFAALADYRTAGGRLVYTVHNWGQHEGEGEAVEQRAVQQLLQLADAVHVHSAAMIPEVEARLPGGRSPLIRVIRHGNYIGAYPNQIDRSAARQRLDLPEEAFVYLFLGLIRPYKGVDELTSAFVQAAGPDARLLIAGQSRPRGYASQLARTRDDPRLRWHTDFVPDDEVQIWMNAADVVVLPYRRITTSGAAMLAWSFGKPVIAPALPAFAESMQNAPFLGVLYDPSNPAALQNALQQARELDPQAQHAQILDWTGQFNWQHIGQHFAGLYEEVIGER